MQSNYFNGFRSLLYAVHNAFHLMAWLDSLTYHLASKTSFEYLSLTYSNEWIVANILCIWVVHLQLLSPSNLRKAALQALLKKIHDAKENKTFGRNLFASVIEPAMSSGAGGNISTSICNMLW